MNNAESETRSLLTDYDPTESRNRERRRRPAPKAHPFWRFVFPVVVVLAGAWTFSLWREGTKAVLDSTDGTVIEIVTDPTQPGYQVFVDPTPTMLLAHVDGDELVGVTVLARTLLDDGGTAVLLSAGLSIDGPGTLTLADLYAAGGVDGLEERVGLLFGFGFLETAPLTTVEMSPLFELVAPLPLALDDDLITLNDDATTSLWLSRGGQQLDAADAATLYAFQNPGEAEANRTVRQLDIWNSWLTEIGRADDLSAAALPFADGLSPYLRALGGGTADVEIVPADPVVREGTPTSYALNEAQIQWLQEITRRMVPLPVVPKGSDQPLIRLLDGTGDAAVAEQAREAMIDLGAQITVLGNASQFGITRSTVTYYLAENGDKAAKLAASIDADVVFDETPEQPVDLTVVIGTEWTTK